jgi:hypothetical protein
LSFGKRHGRFDEKAGLITVSDFAIEQPRVAIVLEESWRPVEADRQATTQFRKNVGPIVQRQ